MYDRETGSLWSQILQQAITGPLTGRKLKMLLVDHTTWEKWRSQHPETQVLSPDTGFDRDYGLNPYQEYWNRGQPMFRSRSSEDLKRKTGIGPMEQVLGVEIKGLHKAYPFSSLESQAPKFQDVVAQQRIWIHFDKASESAYITNASGAVVPSMVTFWFAWTDFYPDTAVMGNTKN